MKYYAWRGYCLCADGGRLPEDAAQAEAPFAPRLYLTSQDPKNGRCLRPGTETAPESWRSLLPQAEPVDAAVLNTAFSRAFELLPLLTAPKTTGLRVTLVGLGDVGGTLLTALKLLAGREIAEIGIYDPYAPLIDRYLLELNQVLDCAAPRIVRRAPDALFDCDIFLFAASGGVPPVGSRGDMRMLQFESNREILKTYAKMARDSAFSGLFCQISDPVDLLCRCVFLQSNRDENGEYDWKGLLPEQIVGFGLGVMAARTRFMAERMGLDPDKTAVYGPHGAGLVAANDPEQYDDALSLELTRLAAEANHEVRALGFKPYIAPALSSACLSLLRLLRGESFYGAIPLGGVYFGCLAQRTAYGLAPIRRAMPEALQARVAAAWRTLKEMDAECGK